MMPTILRIAPFSFSPFPLFKTLRLCVFAVNKTPPISSAQSCSALSPPHTSTHPPHHHRRYLPHPHPLSKHLPDDSDHVAATANIQSTARIVDEQTNAASPHLPR